MDFLTPEIFDRLIIANLLVGVVAAGLRFYRDMKRPLPDERRQQQYDELSPVPDDTQPHRGITGKK